MRGRSLATDPFPPLAACAGGRPKEVNTLPTVEAPFYPVALARMPRVKLSIAHVLLMRRLGIAGILLLVVVATVTANPSALRTSTVFAPAPSALSCTGTSILRSVPITLITRIIMIL